MLARRLVSEEAHIRLVDQGGRLQRLAGRFLGHLLRRQLAQLLVHQWQQLLGGMGIALLGRGQDAGDFFH